MRLKQSDSINQATGRVLRRFRVDKGLSQKETDKLLHRHCTGSMHRIEKGLYHVKMMQLHVLANIYSVSMADIITAIVIEIKDSN